MNKHFSKLKSFDYIIILYTLLTGLYVGFNYNQIENTGHHLIWRFAILIFIYLLLNYNSNHKIILFLRNFYPLLLLGFFYSETGFFNHLIFNNFDPALVIMEEAIFGNQLSLEFSNTIPYKWFSELMHIGYFSYYLLTFGVPFLFYIKTPVRFEKSMFIIIMSFCIYYIIFIVFPSIGPQFYFPIEQIIVPDGFLFDKIMKIIIEIGEAETGAFPSSHVGMAVIFIILIAKYFKKLLPVLIFLVVILIASTVYIKAHYVVDILAGLVTGTLFYYISNITYNRCFNSIIPNKV
jgi:membrane-associated phospholipid phosphatase